MNLCSVLASRTGREAPRGQAVSGCVAVLLTFGSPDLSLGCGTLQVSQYLLDAECVGAPVTKEPQTWKDVPLGVQIVHVGLKKDFPPNLGQQVGPGVSICVQIRVCAHKDTRALLSLSNVLRSFRAGDWPVPGPMRQRKH